MEYLEIGLLILGALFFIGSFFVQEKLSSSDVDEIKKMSEKQINALMERQLRDADAQIDSRIGNKLNESLEKLERETDKETNEKLMSIGEYSDTVMQKMDKTHEEIMFIYQMLDEKQDKLTQLTKDAQNYESHLRGISEEMQKSVTAQASQVETEPAVSAEPAVMSAPAIEVYAAESEPTLETAAEVETEVAEMPISSETEVPEPIAAPAPKKPQPKVSLDDTDDDNKEQIISMFKQGYTQVEIAKKIGVGLGEIQLILGLYGEGNL